MAEFEVVELTARPAAVVRGDIAVGELPAFFGAAFTAAMRVVGTQGAGVAGAPFGYYPSMPGATVQVVAGIPVQRPIESEGEVEPFVLPAGRAVVVVHVGPYDTLEATYGRLLEWVAAQGMELATGMWEEYLSDPEQEPDPATWRTRIVAPVAG